MKAALLVKGDCLHGGGFRMTDHVPPTQSKSKLSLYGCQTHVPAVVQPVGAVIGRARSDIVTGFRSACRTKRPDRRTEVHFLCFCPCDRIRLIDLREGPRAVHDSVLIHNSDITCRNHLDEIDSAKLCFVSLLRRLAS